MNNYIETLDAFFESTTWDIICEEAKQGGVEANDLLENINLRFDSLLFFTKLNDNTRAQKEFALLNKLINYLYETIN